jgi:hypothetical protein
MIVAKAWRVTRRRLFLTCATDSRGWIVARVTAHMQPVWIIFFKIISQSQGNTIYEKGRHKYMSEKCIGYMVSWHIRQQSYFVHMDRGRRSIGTGTHHNLSLQISMVYYILSRFSFFCGKFKLILLEGMCPFFLKQHKIWFGEFLENDTISEAKLMLTYHLY